MMTHRVYWIMVLVIALWVALVPTVLAGDGPDKFSLRLTLDKHLLQPGEAIQVSGIGAIRDVTVGVLLVPFPDSGANALTSVEVRPNDVGAFNATLTVPATTATGRYAVRAEQPPRYGAPVTQYAWVGICVNACTGQTLGSMLPDTGEALPEQTPLPGVLSGWLILALVVNGVIWQIRPR